MSKEYFAYGCVLVSALLGVDVLARISDENMVEADLLHGSVIALYLGGTIYFMYNTSQVWKLKATTEEDKERSQQLNDLLVIQGVLLLGLLVIRVRIALGRRREERDLEMQFLPNEEMYEA